MDDDQCTRLWIGRGDIKDVIRVLSIDDNGKAVVVSVGVTDLEQQWSLLQSDRSRGGEVSSGFAQGNSIFEAIELVEVSTRLDLERPDLVLPSVGRPSNNAVANVAEMVPAVYDSLGSLAANDVVAADDGIDARARDKCPTASLVGTTTIASEADRRVLGRVGAIRDPNRHRSIGGLEAVRHAFTNKDPVAGIGLAFRSSTMNSVAAKPEVQAGGDVLKTVEREGSGAAGLLLDDPLLLSRVGRRVPVHSAVVGHGEVAVRFGHTFSAEVADDIGVLDDSFGGRHVDFDDAAEEGIEYLMDERRGL